MDGDRGPKMAKTRPPEPSANSKTETGRGGNETVLAIFVSPVRGRRRQADGREGVEGIVDEPD